METKELIKAPGADACREGPRCQSHKRGARPGGKTAGGRASLWVRLSISAAVFICAVVMSASGGRLSIKLSEYVAILNSGGEIGEVFDAIGRTVSGEGSFDEIISALMPHSNDGSGEIWERVALPEGMKLVPYTK